MPVSHSIARGLIGPTLVARGIAFGQEATSDPGWDGYMSYSSLTAEFTSNQHPSPRYWLIWPGIACMVSVSMAGKRETSCPWETVPKEYKADSFAELICQWRTFLLSAKVLWKAMLPFSRRVLDAMPQWTSYQEVPEVKYHRPAHVSEDTEERVLHPDPSTEQQVTIWMWMPGLVAVMFATCAVMKTEFDMPISEILLALFLAFFFSLLAIQATGATG